MVARSGGRALTCGPFGLGAETTHQLGDQMIVITGPGRSGTSFIARLYKELGFDPGGEWVAEIEGGLESPAIVAINEEIIEALGVTPMGVPGGVWRTVRHGGKALVPERYRAAIRRRAKFLPWMRRAQPGMLRWQRFDQVVKRFSPRLEALAASHAVCKDSRFLWTLPVWCAAGVPIQHVLISFRNLDATVKSRGRMDSLRFTSESGARNSIVYGMGLTLLAVEEHRVPYSVVRFPDFLDSPAELYRAARFPQPVTESRFRQLVESLRRPDLVHDHR
jgi:hypothetical protein